MRHRRNFLPAFLFTLLIWLIFVSFVITYTPETTLAVVFFYLLFFLAVFFTFALIFGNSRRGALIGVALAVALFLSQIKQAHILNFILLAGLLLSIEIYATKRS